MPSQVIRNYLIEDINDSTASAVMSANPGIFPSASSVPVYLYTSLKTLWTSATGSISDFDRRIVSDIGQAKQVSTGYITIAPLQTESVLADSFLSDFKGAETARIGILYSITRPIPQAYYYQIRNADLRIRMLLDANIRSEAGKSPDIPIMGDPAIDNLQFTPGFMRCFWQRFTNAPNASELVSEYRADYIREFGRQIVNIP